MKTEIKMAVRLACNSYNDDISTFIENEETDTQVLCHEDDEYIYFAVRGTEFDNLDDWFTNLDCSLVKSLNFDGRVHSGFYKDAISVYHDIALYIIERPGKKIIFSGHSQGAAVAALLACLYPVHSFIHAIVLIGCPRIFDHP